MNEGLLKTKIVLENDRIQLIPFEDRRYDELKTIIFDDDIWKYMGMSIRNNKDFDAYVLDTLQQKTEGVCYPFLVIDKKTNTIAGSTRYGYINTVSEKCEIGWTWYGKAFQGTGLNTACKYELLKFGFESIGFRRIQFSADRENIRSQKAIEKLGAIKEGVFRNNYIDIKGNSRDDIYYSITIEEWKDLKLKHFEEQN